MPLVTEDTVLIRQTVAYAIQLYRELSEENGAPSLGTQNQVVDFILADPELRGAAARWSRFVESDEATTCRRGDCRATPPIIAFELTLNRSWTRRFLPRRDRSRPTGADFE